MVRPLHHSRMRPYACLGLAPLLFSFAAHAQHNPSFAGARFAVQGDTGRAGLYSDGRTSASIIDFGGMLFLNDFPSGRSGLVTTLAGDTMVFARAPGVAYNASPKLKLSATRPPSLRITEPDGSMRELRRLRLREEDVVIPAGDVSLGATLVMPEGVPRATIVYVHGSGAATRFAFLGWARMLAAQGFAGIAFDKRGTGLSTGDYRTTDFDGLAADAKAVMKFVRGHPTLANVPVGLLGTSQGGWIIPKVAKGDSVAFLIFSSGGPVSAAEQEMFRRVNKVFAATKSAATADTAREVVRAYFDYLISDGRRSADRTSALWAQLSARPWFAELEVPAADPTTKEWPPARRLFAKDLGLDSASFRAITAPSLVLAGDVDQLFEYKSLIASFESVLSPAAFAKHRSVIVRGGGHGGVVPTPSGELERVAPGYFDALIGWIQSTSR